ncbi:MAG: hypothetical protein JSR73_06510 [Proteobacteria bacterium]|nr:hypothetical protein [Pseudomonadota bacterium]
MRDKFFTMRPKPLERWLWQQGLPASAERVYWYHWDLGARNGTWCSQVSLRVVARECCLDPATVTRAYQLLRRLELLRREDPGRDPRNPFQQATAVTEIRVPRDLVHALAREPNRRSSRPDPQPGLPTPVVPVPAESAPATAATPATLPSRDESREIFARLSAGERSRFAAASAHRRGTLEFDADTRLTAPERAHVLATLDSLARARPAGAPAPVVATTVPRESAPRRLSALDVIRLQKGLRTLAAARAEAPPASLLGEVVYAAEEGALAKYPVPLALNIALKKIREGAWSSPHRMPPDWSLRRALPETCMAAGRI